MICCLGFVGVRRAGVLRVSLQGGVCVGFFGLLGHCSTALPASFRSGFDDGGRGVGKSSFSRKHHIRTAVEKGGYR